MAAVKGLLGLPAFLAGVAALFWCAGGLAGALPCLLDLHATVCRRPERRRHTADRPPLAAAARRLCRVFQGAALTGFLKWWRLGPRNDVEAA